MILVPKSDYLRALARIHQRPKERNSSGKYKAELVWKSRFLDSFLRGGGLFRL
jgi:hypothetical protein